MEAGLKNTYIDSISIKSNTRKLYISNNNDGKYNFKFKESSRLGFIY